MNKKILFSLIALYTFVLQSQSNLSDTLKCYVNKHQAYYSGKIRDIAVIKSKIIAITDTGICINGKRVDSIKVINSDIDDYVYLKDLQIVKSTFKTYLDSSETILTFQTKLNRAIGASRLFSSIIIITIKKDGINDYSICCFNTDYINNPNLSYYYKRCVFFLDFTPCYNFRTLDSSFLDTQDLSQALLLNCNYARYNIDKARLIAHETSEIKAILLNPPGQIVGFDWTIFTDNKFECNVK